MNKVRLIDANALSVAISAEQNALTSDDDKEWEHNKPYFKGLAWAQRLLREAPTIAELSPMELAGLRGMIYRGQIPDAEAALKAREQDA